MPRVRFRDLPESRDRYEEGATEGKATGAPGDAARVQTIKDVARAAQAMLMPWLSMLAESQTAECPANQARVGVNCCQCSISISP